jgi:hypothetical protein
MGTIRSESARVHADTVLDLICANKLPEAAKMAISHFGKSAKIPQMSYSELYYLSFFDLSELS